VAGYLLQEKFLSRQLNHPDYVQRSSGHAVRISPALCWTKAAFHIPGRDVMQRRIIVKYRILAVVTGACLLLVAMATPASAEPVQLGASLSGANEVGDAGDPDGTGSAVVEIDTVTGEVCFNISTAGIADPAAAHIHDAGAGANGGVVVNFDWENTGGVGCVSAPGPTLNAILDAPSLYYVNVHTPEFPAGAVRGQLAVSSGAPLSGPAELAFTGSGLTSLLALGGGALIASGSMITRLAARGRDQ